MPKENIFNVPNLLTMLRMALIGVFIWLFAAGGRFWAMGVFLAAGLTDLLDGYLARKHNQITSFGKLMDPLADKLMLVAALACLTAVGWLPLWIVLAVAAKEIFMVVGGYLLMKKRGIVVQSGPIGKVATAVFTAATVLTFFHESVAPLDLYVQCFAVALTYAAMVWYTVRSVRLYGKKA